MVRLGTFYFTMELTATTLIELTAATTELTASTISEKTDDNTTELTASTMSEKTDDVTEHPDSPMSIDVSEEDWLLGEEIINSIQTDKHQIQQSAERKDNDKNKSQQSERKNDTSQHSIKYDVTYSQQSAERRNNDSQHPKKVDDTKYSQQSAERINKNNDSQQSKKIDNNKSQQSAEPKSIKSMPKRHTDMQPTIRSNQTNNSQTVSSKQDIPRFNPHRMRFNNNQLNFNIEKALKEWFEDQSTRQDNCNEPPPQVTRGTPKVASLFNKKQLAQTAICHIDDQPKIQLNCLTSYWDSYTPIVDNPSLNRTFVLGSSHGAKLACGPNVYNLAIGGARMSTKDNSDYKGTNTYINQINRCPAFCELSKSAHPVIFLVDVAGNDIDPNRMHNVCSQTLTNLLCENIPYSQAVEVAASIAADSEWSKIFTPVYDFRTQVRERQPNVQISGIPPIFRFSYYHNTCQNKCFNLLQQKIGSHIETWNTSDYFFEDFETMLVNSPKTNSRLSRLQLKRLGKYRPGNYASDRVHLTPVNYNRLAKFVREHLLLLARSDFR